MVTVPIGKFPAETPINSVPPEQDLFNFSENVSMVLSPPAGMRAGRMILSRGRMGGRRLSPL